MYDNNVADHSRDLDGGNSRLVKIVPPIKADGTYALEADGTYGPAQPILVADLGVAAQSVGSPTSECSRRPSRPDGWSLPSAKAMNVEARILSSCLERSPSSAGSRAPRHGRVW